MAGRRLELVLPEAATGNAPLFVVHPRRKYLSAKVRTFLDFIAHDPSEIACPSLNKPPIGVLHSDEPLALQRSVAVAADDDVIVHRDAERFCDRDDLPRHRDVLRRGRRIAGGMIVDEHDRRRR